jgi:methyl-accepting chemotaxis protein
MDVRIDWPQYASAIITRIPYAQCFLQGEGGCYKNEAFYRPFSNQRWGLALICQKEQMLAGFYRLQTINLIVIVVVLLLLLFICRKVIDRNLKSLDLLSDTVKHLSQNRFDEPIPYQGRQDEIGELQRSFSLMQQALSSHIREMHQKTEALTQRNAELQAAYERGQEDERAKALFLSKATSQLLPPVQAISAATSRLSTDYQGFTKQEMTDLKTEITTHSETITALSDQMLKI